MIIGRNVASSHAPARHGFTLIEVLIVAVVLVALTATTVPALTALMSGGAIAECRGQVRSFLSAQRASAIDSGNVRWLRWEAGGHHLIAGVDGQRVDAEMALPDDATIASDTAERLDRRWFDGATVSIDPTLADASWAPEVVFYPDGSASQATLTIELGSKLADVTLHQWSGVVE